jgi:hypothetical protein
MRFLPVIVVLLLAGCSHVKVNASSNTSSSTSLSSTSTGAQASVHIESRALAALIITGMFLAAAAEEARDPQPFPSFSAFSDWFRGTPKAELDPERKVSEQDCSHPVDYSLGNIRCK